METTTPESANVTGDKSEYDLLLVRYKSTRDWLNASVFGNILLAVLLMMSIIWARDFERRAIKYAQTMHDESGKLWFVREYNDIQIPLNLEQAERAAQSP